MKKFLSCIVALIVVCMGLVTSSCTGYIEQEQDTPPYYEATYTEKSLFVKVSVSDFAKFNSNLQSVLEAYQCVVKTNSQTAFDNELDYMQITILVPKAKVNDFLVDACKNANVDSRSEYIESIDTDVSALEERIDALQERKAELIALKQTAQEIADILLVDNELKVVNSELIALNNLLNEYNLVANYYTVYLDVYLQTNTFDVVLGFIVILFGYGIVIGLIVAVIVLSVKYSKLKNKVKMQEVLSSKPPKNK